MLGGVRVSQDALRFLCGFRHLGELVFDSVGDRFAVAGPHLMFGAFRAFHEQVEPCEDEFLLVFVELFGFCHFALLEWNG